MHAAGFWIPPTTGGRHVISSEGDVSNAACRRWSESLGGWLHHGLGAHSDRINIQLIY